MNTTPTVMAEPRLRQRASTTSMRVLVATVLAAATVGLLQLPANAHDVQHGPVGPHDPATVTCYANQYYPFMSLSYRAMPAQGWSTQQFAHRYHLWARDRGTTSWHALGWTPWYYDTVHADGRHFNGSNNTVLLPLKHGFDYYVFAEYYWHDGRSWSAYDRVTTTSYEWYWGPSSRLGTTSTCQMY